jgi:2-phosphosulfolactate phosphatase
MKVKLYFTPTPLSEAKVRGRIAVVIDVLRASTSICTALMNGCREVIPVASVGDAAAMRANLDRERVLVCGEREGIKVEGFDLGNSPAEYSEEVVQNKALIFASTNGSRAILKCSPAYAAYVCGFVNMSAIVDTIKSQGKDIAIICAGKQGNFSLEDTDCGGAVIDRLMESGGDYVISNDAAQVALMLYKNRSGSIESVVKQADHARYLMSIGFGEDVVTSSTLDTCPVIPVLSGNKVVDVQRQKVEGTV